MNKVLELGLCLVIVVRPLHRSQDRTHFLTETNCELNTRVKDRNLLWDSYKEIVNLVLQAVLEHTELHLTVWIDSRRMNEYLHIQNRRVMDKREQNTTGAALVRHHPPFSMLLGWETPILLAQRVFQRLTATLCGHFELLKHLRPAIFHMKLLQDVKFSTYHSHFSVYTVAWFCLGEEFCVLGECYWCVMLVGYTLWAC